MTGNPRPLTTAALLAAALAGAPALGQVQAQNGAAHDANQQVGSGGYNQPGQQVDYRARNLLITGNVGGGRAFQDAVGYSAAGSFQGALGSDALFNFRRDSVYSAPGAVGFGVQGRGDRVIVTRPTTNVPGYQVGSGLGLSTRTLYDPQAGVVTFRQNGGGLIAVSGITDPTALPTGDRLGLVQTPNGLVSIDASPLTGVRYNPLDVNTGLIDRNDNADGTPTPDLELDPLDPLNLDRSTTTQSRLDGRRPGDPNNLDAPNLLGDPLAIELGSQLQSAMAFNLTGRENNVPDQQARTIRAQVFGPDGQPQPEQPPENPYDKLIADILAQAQGEGPADDGGQGDDPPDNRPRWEQILEAPDEAVFDARVKAREAAVRISLGMVKDDGSVDFDQPLPSIDPDSELGKLMADLDYELPRVITLAGDRDNRINTLLTRGEQELAAGNYTMAENVYRQVLRETGGDPLAKAGLIHSQMGAGMIRSAAFNLRGLFSDHPELIALRYDTKLMPETDRLRWLQGRLQKLINDNERSADPGLVLAYLGYQLEAQPLIEFGLAVAEAEAPRDPLMPVLRSIWIDGEDAGAEEE